MTLLYPVRFEIVAGLASWGVFVTWFRDSLKAGFEGVERFRCPVWWVAILGVSASLPLGQGLAFALCALFASLSGQSRFWACLMGLHHGVLVVHQVVFALYQRVFGLHQADLALSHRISGLHHFLHFLNRLESRFSGRFQGVWRVYQGVLCD